MRATLSAFLGLVVFSSATMADPRVMELSVECNWGKLTMEAIAGGFPQGPHSSDPSGDGHGPGTADEPRKGLANVVNRGDLQATCEFIESQLQGL